MTDQVFTPKQIALALGVSESSVKRWIDKGRLKAIRTAGGHRKAPISSIADFVRETGHDLSRPEVLGMVAATQRGTLDSALPMLVGAITEGRHAAARELILAFYQRGATVVDLADRLIGPALRRVGDGWESGEISVAQERAACEVLMRVLHELNGWLPETPEGAPTALIASPSNDFALVPAMLLELLLRSAGWRVVHAGCGLPLEEVRDSVLKLRPRLVAISVTHAQDPEAFASDYNDLLVDPTREELGGAGKQGVCHVVGGAAIERVATHLRCDLYARCMADLASLQAELQQAVA